MSAFQAESPRKDLGPLAPAANRLAPAAGCGDAGHEEGQVSSGSMAYELPC